VKGNENKPHGQGNNDFYSCNIVFHADLVTAQATGNREKAAEIWVRTAVAGGYSRNICISPDQLRCIFTLPEESATTDPASQGQANVVPRKRSKNVLWNSDFTH